MSDLLRSIRQFLSELSRRNVYRVALAYLAASFVAVELAEIASGAFGLPGWFEPMVWTVCGIGLPIALVMAWALEVTPEGVRVEKSAGSEEELQASSTTPGVWVGMSVLVLLLLGAWWMWGGLRGGVTAEQAPEIEERSIAVLPFEVSGSGAEDWRDGMVTMLSAGLDGAAGLRAIPDRTVFAKWEESLGANGGATEKEALSVARTIGARYAVVGSASVLGEDLRLLADVYETDSGKRLGQTQVQGSPEEVMTLTNELTRDVLGVLLEESEERIPSVDLASITTSSLEALKAYLRGERHFRAGEYNAAVEDYRRATERDSTFALAYKRLSRSITWSGLPEDSGPPLRRAFKLSEHLPLRERRLVLGQYTWKINGQPRQAIDSLRQWSELYPDDPSIHYELGEVLFHSGIPRRWSKSEEAFKKAVALDPGIAPYHHHLVQLAFSLHRDSALAAKQIETHPKGQVKTLYQVYWDLRFGRPAQKRDARTRLDTIALPALPPADLAVWPFSHPLDLHLQTELLRRFRDRETIQPDRHYNFLLFQNLLLRGKIRAAASLLRKHVDQRFVRGELLRSLTLDYPLPDSLYQPYLEPSEIPEEASLGPFAMTGIYLIERGREEELSGIIDQIRGLKSEGPVLQLEATISELNGYRAWKAGRPEEADRLWYDTIPLGLWGSSGAAVPTGAIWRGDLYREMRQFEKAEGWYLSAWSHPVAHERLGQLYEEMGTPEKAAAAYERFVEAWKDADPELQDRVEKAKERLQSLPTNNS